MRTQNRTTRVLVLSLTTFLLAALVVCSSPSLYAKGSYRNQSQGDSGNRGSNSSQDNPKFDRGSDNSSNSGRGSRSEETPQPKHEHQSEPRVDNPPPPPPPAQNRSDEGGSRTLYQKQQNDSAESYRNSRANNGPSSEDKGASKHTQTQNESQQSGGARNGSNGQSNNNNNGATVGYSSDSKPNDTSSSDNQNRVYRNGGTYSQQDAGHSGSQTDNASHSSNGPELRSIRPDNTISRTVTANPGVFRKDFADLAQIWKNRRERRDDGPIQGSWSGNNNHSGTNVHVNINIFPGSRYGYYQYDYDPYYCYPSVYCYYYGLFPPYIHSRRTVIIHHDIVSYTYVDIPLISIFRDNPDRYDRDDYYLASYRYNDLGPTLRAIERAWKNGEPQLLYDHIRRGSKIDVYLRGDYSYTLDAQDYQDMTSDAMLHITTHSFEFYKVRQRGHGVFVAYGTHTYYDFDSYDSRQKGQLSGNPGYSGTWNTTYVTYTFERIGGEWYITEAGSSPDRL
jgi:hypothetical protein